MWKTRRTGYCMTYGCSCGSYKLNKKTGKCKCEHLKTNHALEEEAA